MDKARRTVFLTMLVFALQPLAFGAWLALIPHVKETLALSKAELAIALLGMPLGVLPGLQLGGRLMGRIGPRRVLAIAFPLQALAMALPVIAPSQAWLFAALFILGTIFAQLQISLNTYAGRLEKNRNLIIMSRCHGFWALGVTVGALLLSALVGLAPVAAIMVIGLPSAVAGTIAALSLERFPGQEGGPSLPRRRLSEIPAQLVLISIVTLAVSMTEGAMSDWSAVYLAERLPEGAQGAGMAVSIFAGFLAAGRFLGDFAKRRFGVVRLARATLVLAGAGLACLILPLPLWAAYLGFACVGLGVSVGFPLGVSAAASLDHTHEGPNIAILSTVTMVGFLIGPPMIGGLADLFSLRAGFAALLPGLVLGVVLARNLSTRTGPGGVQSPEPA